MGTDWKGKKARLIKVADSIASDPLIRDRRLLQTIACVNDARNHSLRKID